MTDNPRMSWAEEVRRDGLGEVIKQFGGALTFVPGFENIIRLKLSDYARREEAFHMLTEYARKKRLNLIREDNHTTMEYTLRSSGERKA